MRRALLMVVTAGLALLVTSGSASAQSRAANPTDPFQMWNVDQMIDRATGQVTKRYQLTDEQTAYTRELMSKRVNAFLDSHEQEIREIFAEAIKYQISGNPPPPERVQEWTRRIDPMFDEAKGLILDGNHDFREILSDEQKLVHDIDLQVMEENFRDAEGRLTRWREGDYDPKVDFQPGVPAPPAQPQPQRPVQPRPRPTQPAPTVKPAPAPEAPAAPAAPAPAPTVRQPQIVGPTDSAMRSMDIWEMYVRRFISNYGLDKTQATQAWGILSDVRKRASEYITSRKDEYEKLQTQLAAAGSDAKAAAAAREKIAELNKPVQEGLFGEMKQRLDQIPTDAQRQAYEKAHGKPRPGDDKPGATSGPSTRPAPKSPKAAAASQATR